MDSRNEKIEDWNEKGAKYWRSVVSPFDPMETACPLLGEEERRKIEGL